jgi:hypothetical protein
VFDSLRASQPLDFLPQIAKLGRKGEHLMIRIALFLACLFGLTVSAAAQGYGNPYGNSSNSPHIYAPNGRYLGNLNSNQYDPNSVSNPYGRYGSQYSPDSINNPYGQYHH